MNDKPPSYADASTLGKATDSPRDYSPGVLQPIARADYRATVPGLQTLAMVGEDLWHCYEVSWLNARGKPHVTGLRISVPADSPNIFESKSLKLYLGSLNFHKLESETILLRTVERDLEACTGSRIDVELYAGAAAAISGTASGSILLDTLDVDCDQYQPDPGLLQLTGGKVENESLLTHLLRTNCPVTGQPDWASLELVYSGAEICRDSLLRYIVSYRNHCGFHEQSVEKIYTDLWQRCQPESLAVNAHYTRRGGIDICPFRSSERQAAPRGRYWRQ